VEIDRELHEASRRRALYAKDRPTINVRDKTAIIADDGVATGLTMSAAVLDVRAKSPARIIVAAPVIPEDIKTKLAYQVDEVAALHTPTNGFGAIGQYYDSFDPIEDDEVIALLNQFD
jgi:predicted phosphoribosyltransferase